MVEGGGTIGVEVKGAAAVEIEGGGVGADVAGSVVVVAGAGGGILYGV